MKSMVSYKESLYVKIVAGVGIIEFGSEKSNSLSQNLLDRLSKALDDFSDDDQVNLILLKSEGNTVFCAGASLSELKSLNNIDQATDFFTGFAKVILSIRNNRKIVIARAQGKSVGGGVGILASCDYVMATEASAIRLSELNIGLAPLVIAPAITRKMGVQALADMTLQPKQWYNVYWAERKGLYSKIFESVKELDKELDVLVKNLSGLSVLALSTMKKALWEAEPSWEKLLRDRASASAKLSLSAQCQQAIKDY